MCAEAVGAMDHSLKSTVEYLKTRKQFGVPIGSFQTLQHRAADMFVALEQARSMSMFATMAAHSTAQKSAPLQWPPPRCRSVNPASSSVSSRSSFTAASA